MSTTTPAPEHQVVVVDVHLMCAQSLEIALRQEGYAVTLVEFPGPPYSALPLVACLLQLSPQVVLLDLDLGYFGDGLPLIEPAVRSGAHVVVLSDTVDEVRWADAVDAGACAVIDKTRPLADVLGVVGSLVAGLPVMSSTERDGFLELAARHRAGHAALWERLDSLSMREGEVLGLLMQGHTVREIAAYGRVAEATVRTQVKHILGKLDVSSQLAAVGLARRLGWRPPLPLPLSS